MVKLFVGHAGPMPKKCIVVQQREYDLTELGVKQL